MIFLHPDINFTLADDGPTENPLESLYLNATQSPKDMSEDRRDAWRYGITTGWDDKVYSQLQVKHGWTDADVARNRRMHDKFLKAWVYVQSLV